MHHDQHGNSRAACRGFLLAAAVKLKLHVAFLGRVFLFQKALRAECGVCGCRADGGGGKRGGSRGKAQSRQHLAAGRIG